MDDLLSIYIARITGYPMNLFIYFFNFRNVRDILFWLACAHGLRPHIWAAARLHEFFFQTCTLEKKYLPNGKGNINKLTFFC
jgi:hypothetical protein